MWQTNMETVHKTYLIFSVWESLDFVGVYSVVEIGENSSVVKAPCLACDLYTISLNTCSPGCCAHLECQEMGRCYTCRLPLRSKGWALPKMTGTMTANCENFVLIKKAYISSCWRHDRYTLLEDTLAVQRLLFAFCHAGWISLHAFQMCTSIWKIPNLSTGNIKWSTQYQYVRAQHQIKSVLPVCSIAGNIACPLAWILMQIGLIVLILSSWRSSTIGQCDKTRSYS